MSIETLPLGENGAEVPVDTSHQAPAADDGGIHKEDPGVQPAPGLPAP